MILNLRLDKSFSLPSETYDVKAVDKSPINMYDDYEETAADDDIADNITPADNVDDRDVEDEAAVLAVDSSDLVLTEQQSKYFEQSAITSLGSRASNEPQKHLFVCARQRLVLHQLFSGMLAAIRVTSTGHNPLNDPKVKVIQHYAVPFRNHEGYSSSQTTAQQAFCIDTNTSFANDKKITVNTKSIQANSKEFFISSRGCLNLIASDSGGPCLSRCEIRYQADASMFHSGFSVIYKLVSSAFVALNSSCRQARGTSVSDTMDLCHMSIDALQGMQEARLNLSQMIDDDKRLLEFVAVTHEVRAHGCSQFTGTKGSRSKFMFAPRLQQYFRRAIYNPFFPTINRLLSNAPVHQRGKATASVDEWYHKFRGYLANKAGVDLQMWDSVSNELRKQLLQQQITLMDPFREMCLSNHKASIRPEGRACADRVCSKCFTVFPKQSHSGISIEDLFLQHPCKIGSARSRSDIILTNTGKYGEYIRSEYLAKFHPDQRDAAQEIQRGSNVMLFGPAGAGKTFVYQGMRHLKILQNGEENTISTATLKIISQVNDGHTLHHMFALPTDALTRYNLVCGSSSEKLDKATKHIRENAMWFDKLFGPKGERYQSSLFLDECSSLTCNDFDFILCLLTVLFCSVKPFGGLQVILSGDPLQNACITLKKDDIEVINRYGKYDAAGELPFFTSTMFKKYFNICMIFGKGHRFEGDDWYQILLRMRTNRNTEKDFDQLNELLGANGMTSNTEYIDCANALAVHFAKQPKSKYEYKISNGWLYRQRIDPAINAYHSFQADRGSKDDVKHHNDTFDIFTFIMSQANVRETTPNGIILTTENVQQEAYRAMETVLRNADSLYDHQSEDTYFINRSNGQGLGFVVPAQDVTLAMKVAAEKATMRKLQQNVNLTPGTILTINENKAGYYLYNGMRVRVVSYDPSTQTLLVLPLDATNRGRIYTPQVLPQLTMTYDIWTTSGAYKLQRRQFPVSYGSTLSVMAIAGLTFDDDCIYFDNTRCMLTSAFYQFCSRVRSPKQLWCRHSVIRLAQQVKDNCGGWSDIRIDVLCREFNDCCEQIKAKTECHVFPASSIFDCPSFIEQIGKSLTNK